MARSSRRRATAGRGAGRARPAAPAKAMSRSSRAIRHHRALGHVLRQLGLTLLCQWNGFMVPSDPSSCSTIPPAGSTSAIEHAWEASDRIHQLIHKSDVHLSQTVYIQDAARTARMFRLLLQQALHDNAMDEDHSIDCMFDPPRTSSMWRASARSRRSPRSMGPEPGVISMPHRPLL